MLKKGVLVLVLILVLSAGAFGFEKVITTNLAVLTPKVINLRYERALSEKWSIAISPLFLFGEVEGLGSTLEMRRYISVTAPEGLFIGVSGVLMWLGMGAERGYAHGFGGDVGYKWVFDNGLVFEAGVEVKYVSTTMSYLRYSGVGFVTTYLFGIGYAFW